jgi:hypothetical protein
MTSVNRIMLEVATPLTGLDQTALIMLSPNRAD